MDGGEHEKAVIILDGELYSRPPPPPFLSLPYPTYPTLPCTESSLPYLTLPYPSLSYRPSLPFPESLSLPYPTLLYLTFNPLYVLKGNAGQGREGKGR